MVYHVRITKKSDKWNDCLEFDLSKNSLVKKIIEPYHKGKKFVCSGEVINPFDIDKIKINETLEKSSVLIPKINTERRQTTIATPINDDWYVTEKGNDVTTKFIKYPPKKGDKEIYILNIKSIIFSWIIGFVVLLLINGYFPFFGEILNNISKMAYFNYFFTPFIFSVLGIILPYILGSPVYLLYIQLFSKKIYKNEIIIFSGSVTAVLFIALFSDIEQVSKIISVSVLFEVIYEKLINIIKSKKSN